MSKGWHCQEEIEQFSLLSVFCQSQDSGKGQAGTMLAIGKPPQAIGLVRLPLWHPPTVNQGLTMALP
jgi:hypothetical protein